MASEKLKHIGTRADGSTFVRTTVNIPSKYVTFVRKSARKTYPGTSRQMGVSGFIVRLIEMAKKNFI